MLGFVVTAGVQQALAPAAKESIRLGNPFEDFSAASTGRASPGKGESGFVKCGNDKRDDDVQTCDESEFSLLHICYRCSQS